MSLGHLWFLWYLAWISALFMGGRWLALRLGHATMPLTIDRHFGRIVGSRLAPLWLALPVLPWLAAMPRYDVESPSTGFVLRLPALAIFGFFFVVGWWLHRQRSLLDVLARRWAPLLLLGFVSSLLVFAAEWWRIQTPPDAWTAWDARGATCLTMTLSSLGWIGLFVAQFREPSPRLRYVADASYWIYLAHLPVIVALQVWWVGWTSVWWKLLTINALSLAILFASYQLCVRHTWIGRWLQGSRPPARTTATAAS